MVQSLHEFLEENINYLKENGLYNEIDTNEGTNEDVLKRDDKLSEEIESGPEDREVVTPKKGFRSRMFGS